MALPRVVVLASGGGTNFQALLDATAQGRLEVDIVALVTNNAAAGAVDRARTHGVAVEVVDHRGRDPRERAAADQRLIDTIASFNPDLVVLAGWMRILGDAVCARFRIINLHPARPGDFAGVNAIGRAFAAWQNGEIESSGVMIHWVPDSGVDVGPVITERSVPFEPGDTLASFEARMHATEHRLIVEGVRIALQEREIIDN